MEQFLDDSSNILVKDNNNVVDNLELLKENQTCAMQTAEQIDSLVKETEPKTDDLLNLNEEIDNKIKSNEESNIKFENLIQNKESDALINEFTDQANESTDQTNESTDQTNESTDQTNESTDQTNESTDQTNESTDQTNESTDQTNDRLNDLLIETTENKTESTDLSKSTIQLLEDLNFTPNTLDSSRNTTNSEFNLTAEKFLEQPRETIENSILIDNSLDSSVKETMYQNDQTMDSNQSQSEAKNLNEKTETTPEIFLDQLNHKHDDSKLTDQSIQEINLADQSSTQQISLIEISNESITNDQIEQKEELSLLDQISRSEESDNKTNTLDALVNNDKKDEIEFLEDLSKEIVKKADDFMDNLKLEEENQDQKVSEQSPQDQAKLILEDFVTKNDEIATDECKSDNLIREDTFIVKKLDECKISDELKNPTEVETQIVETEISQKIEEDKPQIVYETPNLDNQEAVSSKSKVNDIFTESQELLKQADKLIAEKRNSINEIDIPGLNMKITPEPTIEEQTADEQPEKSTKVPEASLPEQTNETAKEKSKSERVPKESNHNKRCVIS